MCVSIAVLNIPSNWHVLEVLNWYYQTHAFAYINNGKACACSILIHGIVKLVWNTSLKSHGYFCFLAYLYSPSCIFLGVRMIYVVGFKSTKLNYHVPTSRIMVCVLKVSTSSRYVEVFFSCLDWMGILSNPKTILDILYPTLLLRYQIQIHIVNKIERSVTHGNSP